MKEIHPSLTHEILIEAVENQSTGLENPGFCISCGAQHDDCEPDAQEYECEECGEYEVYGAEEILLTMTA